MPLSPSRNQTWSRQFCLALKASKPLVDPSLAETSLLPKNKNKTKKKKKKPSSYCFPCVSWYWVYHFNFAINHEAKSQYRCLQPWNSIVLVFFAHWSTKGFGMRQILLWTLLYSFQLLEAAKWLRPSDPAASHWTVLTTQREVASALKIIRKGLHPVQH
jgi:hypothetical protein